MLVAAPTGAGKTVVGEFAAWLALREGGKCFYTTPIKALSNQKYSDFLALHGSENVGLLTGDNSINGDAAIVVMTTEVLRNMIYEDSQTLEGLHYVVLDEVHYLQDPYRGAVWEEILIHLPVDVQAISLSATVSNSEEFGEWLQTLRGRVEVIIEEKRPVELRHWYFAADELLPMFVVDSSANPMPNPRGRDFDRRKRASVARPQRGQQRDRTRRRIPLRTDVVERLRAERMLPAIYFIFSRKGCDEAVRQALRSNLRLTTEEERARIVEYADARVSELPADELELLGYGEWIEGLSRGIAAHHAGMIPPFKEAVEELFAQGLVKVVFATETLALGINMPARTVVVESLMKFTGEKHELMTPGEYTQLAGRAGRRGIDELGHSVVLLQRFVTFDTITRLASTRTYPLRSSFQPSYNMAVNLVRNYDREEAEHLVNSSFAQFQADRHVVNLEQSKEQQEAYLASYRERTRCDLGDFSEYRQVREELSSLEGQARKREGRNRAGRVTEAMEELRPGDVFQVPGGRRRGRYLVLESGHRGQERTRRLVALSEQRSVVRFGPNDFREPPVPFAHLKVNNGALKDHKGRRDLARKLEQLKPPRRERAPRLSDDAFERIATLRDQLESHPSHRCPELGRHLHFAERAARLERELRTIDRRIRSRTSTLAARFDRVLEILEKLGYVRAWELTEKGETLTRVYNEAELIVVEALEQGLLDALSPAETAAVLSTLVYEARGPEPEVPAELPTPGSRNVYARLVRLWQKIRKEEEQRGLDLTREPDPGFAVRAYLWASGAPLEEVLDYDAAAGDFVRSVKQLSDLLRQVEEIVPSEQLSEKVREAVRGVHRGVVAYSSLEV